MSKFSLEDFYFESTPLRSKLLKEGRIRKVYKGFYTSINDEEVLREKIKFNWPLVVANCFKTSVVSYRTAIEFKPSPQGYIFLVSKNTKEVEIAGLKFKHIKGEVQSSTDRNALMGAKVACKERAFLESLITPRHIPNDDRYLSRAEIEDKIERILEESGEEGLNSFRDRARVISEELGLELAFNRLDKIIGALLGSKSIELHGPRAMSRSTGLPVDTSRIDLFMKLAAHLESLTFPSQFQIIKSSEHIENKSFFESYFSNYIEGTEFLIEEAEEIVFDKKLISNRPQDSHDILDCFKICSDTAFMREKIVSANRFLEDLKSVNKKIISSRKDKSPGDFKVKANKAGNTLFVKPDYVEGTLTKSFEIYQTLSSAIGRAIFLSFIISEVHPFNDGNGRTSRIFLNRELISNGLPSIIIPTVYRDDYIGALRAISRKGRVEPICKMFINALKFSNLDFTNYSFIKEKLTECNWFLSPEDGKILI